MFKKLQQTLKRRGWGYLAATLILLGTWSSPIWGIDFTVTRVTDNNYDDFRPQLNNRGQLAWMADVDRDDYEILFYNQGATKPVTTNSVKDAFPCLNDAGLIAWLGGNRSETTYLFNNGVTTKISVGESSKGTPAISNTGKVVWENPVGNNHDQILQYSTSGLTQIYYEPYGLGFWNVQMNGRDQIAWESQDFIYLYTNGVTTKITAKSSRDKYLQLNNRGEMVWSTLDPGGDREIYLYSNGAIKQLSANDYEDFCPEINDAGLVAWLGKVDDQDYEVFL